MSRTLSAAKTFHFPSLSGTEPSREIPASIFAANQRFILYLDTESQVPADDLTTLWNLLVDRYLPRTESLWGRPGPSAGDAPVEILVTHRINDNKSVIGFFNPADLFPQVNDVNSPDYNPGSNEGKILYVGCPDPNENAYSCSSIMATAVHEYQHLIHFSRKTLGLAQLGNYSRFREAVFLDEGLSHLTESLVGLGVAGGNILFVSHYLNQTEDYSLLFSDRSGRIDNPGIRGAMSLYLFWLFQNHGGGDWDPAQPTRFRDGGGLQFLRKLIDTNLTGVVNLEHVLAKSYAESLSEWALSLNNNSVATVPLDPSGTEPIGVTPFMGTLTLSSGQVRLDGPRRHPFLEPRTILPFSFVFFDDWSPPTAPAVHFHGIPETGPAFLTLVHLP